MVNFFAELKRRQMFRVAAAYAVVAWVLLQLINNLAQALKLPDWVPATVVVLLALGFPVALLFAWIQQMAPAGATAHEAKANRLDWILAGGIAAVIAIFLFQQFASGPTTVTQPKGVDAAKSAANSPTSAISLAVLPFSNLSSDPEQEFFSDGITEEITTALAKVPDLRVVGRTSAFQFKGKSQDLRAIGQMLSATHLIEGSVRKAGDRVRITAQLIKADDGTHLWADNYDREISDVFAIQEEIARAIATSMRMPLGLKPGENLVSSRNIDPELYQEYLRIRAKGKTAASAALFQETAESLEKLVARAPNFAQAWASLSGLYINTLVLPTHARLLLQPVEESRRQVSLGYEKTEKAAREAIRLDAAQAGAYRTLAELEAVRSHWAAAEDLFRKGLELDPNETTLLQWYGFFSLRTGRLRQALPLMQEAHALEPLVPAANGWLALAHIHNGQPDAAIALLEGRPGISLLGLRWLARAYANRGQFDKAADNIMSARGRGPDRSAFEEAARLIRNAPQKVSDPKALPPLHEDVAFVYAYVGAEDRLLDVAERAFEADMFGTVRYLFAPSFAPARKTERFKTLVRKAGLVDYWRERGWPDLCRPVGADDFECE